MKHQPDIRRELARSVIKEPLLSLLERADSGEPIGIIVEVNPDYYAGGKVAAGEIAALVDVNPIDSLHRYFRARLTAAEILRLVETNSRDAARLQTAAHSTSRAGHFLKISRIWLDHSIEPLIDKSAATIKADAAHRAFLAEGKDIVWAVIDSGIDGSHQHFQGRQTLSTEGAVVHCDFTGEGQPLVDQFGHGTQVAGIIAGSLNSGTKQILSIRTQAGEGSRVEVFEEALESIQGIAPACRLVSLKVLDASGKGEISNILAALDRVQEINEHGRNIRIHGVNLSVGYEFDPAWFACGQSPVCAEVNRLVRSGVVVVVAAGNTGHGYLASQQRTTGAGMMLTINDPGNAALAITVGSTHRDAPHVYGVSYFSSKGPTGDGRAKPDLVAPGERILSCCSSSKAPDGGTNTYVEDSGTSMAAPHVSGAIAAFLSIRREYIGYPEKVKDVFLASATDLGRNPYFQGKGLLDLMRAIQSV